LASATFVCRVTDAAVIGEVIVPQHDHFQLPTNRCLKVRPAHKIRTMAICRFFKYSEKISKIQSKHSGYSGESYVFETRNSAVFTELSATFTNNLLTFPKNGSDDSRMNTARNRPIYQENRSLERKNHRKQQYNIYHIYTCK
jgi:hypothetical protein